MRLPLDSNRQIFHEFAADPHFADVLGLGQDTDPVEGIFRESEEICVVPGLELSAFRPLRAQSERPRRRRGFDGLKRFHSGLDEMAHLVAVEPPSGRSTGGREDVGPGRHPHALANRDPQRLLVLLVNRHGLAVRILGDSAFLPDANEAIDDEPCWHEDRIAGEHQVRGFFIEECPMLDRPASGSERGDDSGFAVAVGGNDSVRAGRSPTIASSSSRENCAWTGWSSSLATPPDARTLMTLAPIRSCIRTPFKHSGTPSQRYEKPVRRNTSWMKSSGNAWRSPWPPV